MLIQDLRFIEATDAIDNVHGGTSAFTGVKVSANGGSAGSDAYAAGFGYTTNAATTAGTRAAKGTFYELSAATGTAVSWAVTVDGKNSTVATSVSTGVATDFKRI
jgi:hypothetical protein